jgi:hypothetical protein
LNLLARPLFFAPEEGGKDGKTGSDDRVQPASAGTIAARL